MEAADAMGSGCGRVVIVSSAALLKTLSDACVLTYRAECSPPEAAVPVGGIFCATWGGTDE